jgi:small-conductance mechanosensitive channel
MKDLLNIPWQEAIAPLLILLITMVVGFIVDKFFRFQIKKLSADMNSDPTNYKFLRRAIIVLIYIVGVAIAIYSVQELRVLAKSLLAGAGVLAVAVGFASQQALGNIISGVFIVIFKPFRINDRLRIGDKNGFVEDITLRHTVIRDFENRRIIIPNALMSSEVIINADYGDDEICKWIDVGIAYDADLAFAKAIIKEHILAHPLHIDTRTALQLQRGDELAPVKVITLGDSSVNLRGWAWAKDSADAFTMGCDLLESIKLRFDVEGIEIPFPHRTIVYKDTTSPENRPTV